MAAVRYYSSPAGDEKRISFENQANDGHFILRHGSSGRQHSRPGGRLGLGRPKAVPQVRRCLTKTTALSGNCMAGMQPAERPLRLYRRFAMSWTGGGTAQSRLELLARPYPHRRCGVECTANPTAARLSSIYTYLPVVVKQLRQPNCKRHFEVGDTVWVEFLSRAGPHP